MRRHPAPEYPRASHPRPFARTWQELNPGSGWCLRCGTPWAFTEPHTVNVDSSLGRFPCCESCWSTMDLPDRLTAMSTLLDLDDQWQSYFDESPVERHDTIMAVINEEAT